ncbi:hypothetical protein BJ999_000152 [Actinomadura citrea]|uniref:Uncharacterized protein n=1 Tax=Actinomadura citrea TaxID=46158 RepID=A0A7Y9G516_9ACTN|nr:hypothetical protein [Actinomadura citrea]GGT63862.1 hypothetical protein GCM10010177_21300 [Actinomadura citrea]
MLTVLGPASGPTSQGYPTTVTEPPNPQVNGGWSVEVHGDEWLIFAALIFGLVILPAVWSTKKSRRDAALEVLRTFMRWR